jgi:hypothetical protein
VDESRVEDRLAAPAYRANLPPGERGEQQRGRDEQPPVMGEPMAFGVDQRQQQTQDTGTQQETPDQVEVDSATAARAGR